MESGPVPRRPPESRAHGKTAAALDLGSARILIVDRDILSQRMTAATLEQSGLDIVVKADRGEVMPALEDHAIDVVVLDIGFPDGGGTALMQEIHGDRRYSDLPIVLLSSPNHHDEAMGLLERGADDVLLKPVEPRVLVARIQSALRARRALLGMEAAHAVIAALANEMNARDADISDHTERIGGYAAELGRRVRLSAADQHAVAYSILLHDLGRIGISESILLKQGPLSDDERKAIMRHTEIGERIAAPLPGSERFGPIIRHHHERWDGGGYPDWLLSHKIPMGARIISIVDAFDAMTQYRPYREPRSVPEAIDELRRERGKQFDPSLVDAFVRVLEWDGIA
ncbi:MAG: HD domain-containing phosphohydrolase [Chloroflexota bacterium]